MKNLNIPFERIEKSVFDSVDMRPSAHLCTFTEPLVDTDVLQLLPAGSVSIKPRYALYYDGTLFYIMLSVEYFFDGIYTVSAFYFRSV